MVRVLVAGILALLISVLAGPKFIEFLRRNEFGQHIREEGPQHHHVKQGTPAMGGLLIMLALAVAYLALSRYSLPALTVFFVTLGCAAIGFADDFVKLTHRRSLGLRGRWKMVLLAGITVIVGLVANRVDLPGDTTAVYFPVVDWRIDLGWGWYVLLFFIIAGFANAVNLTDGLDGLASGSAIISVFTFTTIAVATYIRSGPGTAPGRDVDSLDLAILGAAIIGATVGFLWYNAFPAEVFMGDTGSMALGGALAAFAIMTKTEFVLLLIGGIYVLEALSVMIQVFSFKYFGKRVFLMTPIHHHFEMKAWSETKIMVRFWIAGAILCALGFVLWYRYYVGFRA